MKSAILRCIYAVFADWSRDLPAVCRQGCSACCTQNVTITAIEGEEILRYIVAENLGDWLAERLARPISHRSATMTTNEFAAACLEGREVDPGDHGSIAPCPFLEDNLCRIYPVRPFSCRVFTSTRQCSALQPALVPDTYFEAATAVTQLVEHVGQKEYWGNMLDVLSALLDISAFREIGDRLGQNLVVAARLRTLTAKPLPGFLLSEEEGGKVSQLLEDIFSSEVDGRRLEDILNGR
jgi:Fe-S-cluster containining protein